MIVGQLVAHWQGCILASGQALAPELAPELVPVVGPGLELGQAQALALGQAPPMVGQLLACLS